MTDPDPIDQALLKHAHNSLNIVFGTNAPYAIADVRAEKIGFASTPCVVVDFHCHSRDVPSLVPIIRQRVYRELAERGWTPDDIEFVPSVQPGRERMFVDANESSESVGRRKRGAAYRMSFEMERELARATFDPRVRPGQTGSYATLPDYGSG